MSFPEEHFPVNRPADASDYGQPHRHEPRKTSCPLGDHVVTDPVASAFILMTLWDLVERRVVYQEAHDKNSKLKCPLIKCYKQFSKPMEVIKHLLDCPWLRHGEFNCPPCDNWHGFPTDEKALAEFRGWVEPEDPARARSRRSFKEAISEKLRLKTRVHRTPGRSDSASSAVSVLSSSCGSSPASPAGGGLRNLDWRYSPNDFGNYPQTRKFLPEATQKEPMPVHQEPANTAGKVSELFSPPVSGTVTPPRPNHVPPQQPSMIPPWESSNSMGVGGSNHGQFDKTCSLSDTYLLTPHSSMDSGARGAMPQLQIPEVTQYFGSGFTESPDSIEGLHVGSQPGWLPPASGPASHSVWPLDVLRPSSEQPMTGVKPTQPPHPHELTAGTGIGHRSNPGAQLIAKTTYQCHPSPPPQVHQEFGDMLQDPVATETSATGPSQQSPFRSSHSDPQPAWGGSGHAEPELLVPAGFFGVSASQLTELPADAPPVELATLDYKCDQCPWRPRPDGRREKFGSYLRKHKKTHKGIKIPCTHCGRLYTRSDNLAKHMSKHVNDVPGGSSDGTFSQAGGGSSGRRRWQNTAELEGSAPIRRGTFRGAKGKRALAGGTVEIRRTPLQGQILMWK